MLGTEKGALLGLILGTDDGGTECTAEGTADGTVLGTTLGSTLGIEVGMLLGEILSDKLGMEVGVVDGDAHEGKIKLVVNVNATPSSASTSTSKAAEIVSSSRIEIVPTYPSMPAVKKTVSPDDESKTLYSSSATKVGWLQSGSEISAVIVPPGKRSIL